MTRTLLTQSQQLPSRSNRDFTGIALVQSDVTSVTFRSHLGSVFLRFTNCWVHHETEALRFSCSWQGTCHGKTFNRSVTTALQPCQALHWNEWKWMKSPSDTALTTYIASTCIKLPGFSAQNTQHMLEGAPNKGNFTKMATCTKPPPSARFLFHSALGTFYTAILTRKLLTTIRESWRLDSHHEWV